MAKTKEQLLNILDQFQLTEKVVSAEPFGNGHINDTLKVTNEIGEILGLRADAVRTRMSRARMKLKHVLEGLGYGRLSG